MSWPLVLLGVLVALALFIAVRVVALHQALDRQGRALVRLIIERTPEPPR